MAGNFFVPLLLDLFECFIVFPGIFFDTWSLLVFLNPQTIGFVVSQTLQLFGFLFPFTDFLSQPSVELIFG